MPARLVTPSSLPATPCAFVVARRRAGGRRSSFCDAPALSHSAYCARHHAALRPRTAQAALAGELERAAEEAAPLPPELAGLAPVALPESEPEAPDEIIAALPLPRRASLREAE